MEQTRAYLIAQKCARVLKERFHVGNVYIFGSVTGDGIWHERSDIDIAVEGLRPTDYMRALNAVGELLPGGLELDLVSLEDVPLEFKARIRHADLMVNPGNRGRQIKEQGETASDGDVKMPVKPIDRLKEQIKLELGNLSRVTQELDDFLKQSSDRQPNTIEVSGIGGHLHNFYMGVERIFERIAVTLDGGLPTGESWHTLLLQQMEIEYPGTRPAVIDHSLALRLLDYLRFRHLYRNTYGYELLWEKCCPLAENLLGTLEIFQEQLSRFFDRLEEVYATQQK
ncbi:nucleotidyltransferase domain-containing protein [Candidatus Poribacteria bacterium]|nr:nucleotidyltransferase domain-containing protein [Candidatus Poribacteria bacterium]